MSEGYLMGLEMHADGLRRLREANGGAAVQRALENFRFNMAAMRNDTKEGNNMVTVEQVRDLGIEFVADDIVAGVSGENSNKAINCAPNTPPEAAFIQTNLGFMHPRWLVKEFAPRKNEGVQPVGDDVLVDVVPRNGVNSIAIAEVFRWDISGGLGDIITWKPSMKNWEQNMNDNQEIKIDLTCADDEQGQVEWKSGDKCTYMGAWAIVIGWHPQQPLIVIDTNAGFEAVRVDELSEPETPEQREERERMEAAYDLYCTWCGIQHETASFEEWLDAYRDVWLRIVDKTGYRLGSK